jgi:hypothetical protein
MLSKNRIDLRKIDPQFLPRKSNIPKSNLPTPSSYNLKHPKPWTTATLPPFSPTTIKTSSTLSPYTNLESYLKPCNLNRAKDQPPMIILADIDLDPKTIEYLSTHNLNHVEQSKPSETIQKNIDILDELKPKNSNELIIESIDNAITELKKELITADNNFKPIIHPTIEKDLKKMKKMNILLTPADKKMGTIIIALVHLIHITYNFIVSDKLKARPWYPSPEHKGNSPIQQAAHAIQLNFNKFMKEHYDNIRQFLPSGLLNELRKQSKRTTDFVNPAALRTLIKAHKFIKQWLATKQLPKLVPLRPIAANPDGIDQDLSRNFGKQLATICHLIQFNLNRIVITASSVMPAYYFAHIIPPANTKTHQLVIATSDFSSLYSMLELLRTNRALIVAIVYLYRCTPEGKAKPDQLPPTTMRFLAALIAINTYFFSFNIFTFNGTPHTATGGKMGEPHVGALADVYILSFELSFFLIQTNRNSTYMYEDNLVKYLCNHFKCPMPPISPNKPSAKANILSNISLAANPPFMSHACKPPSRKQQKQAPFTYHHLASPLAPHFTILQQIRLMDDIQFTLFINRMLKTTEHLRKYFQFIFPAPYNNIDFSDLFSTMDKPKDPSTSFLDLNISIHTQTKGSDTSRNPVPTHIHTNRYYKDNFAHTLPRANTEEQNTVKQQRIINTIHNDIIDCSNFEAFSNTLHTYFKKLIDNGHTQDDIHSALSKAHTYDKRSMLLTQRYANQLRKQFMIHRKHTTDPKNANTGGIMNTKEATYKPSKAAPITITTTPNHHSNPPVPRPYLIITKKNDDQVTKKRFSCLTVLNHHPSTSKILQKLKRELSRIPDDKYKFTVAEKSNSSLSDRFNFKPKRTIDFYQNQIDHLTVKMMRPTSNVTKNTKDSHNMLNFKPTHQHTPINFDNDMDMISELSEDMMNELKQHDEKNEEEPDEHNPTQSEPDNDSENENNEELYQDNSEEEPHQDNFEEEHTPTPLSHTHHLNPQHLPQQHNKNKNSKRQKIASNTAKQPTTTNDQMEHAIWEHDIVEQEQVDSADSDTSNRNPYSDYDYDKATEIEIFNRREDEFWGRTTAFRVERNNRAKERNTRRAAYKEHLAAGHIRDRQR